MLKGIQFIIAFVFEYKNAIVNEHVFIAVAVVFHKLSNSYFPLSYLGHMFKEFDEFIFLVDKNVDECFRFSAKDLA